MLGNGDGVGDTLSLLLVSVSPSASTHEEIKMNENSNAAAQEPPTRRWWIAKAVGLGVFLVVTGFVVFQVIFDLPHDNEFGLRGGLSIVVD